MVSGVNDANYTLKLQQKILSKSFQFPSCKAINRLDIAHKSYGLPL